MKYLCCLVKFLDYQTNTLHHINVIPTLLDFKIHVAIISKNLENFIVASC